jgi:hypothetical protein
VVQDCARIIDILTEPANRVALEAELALALAWYHGGGGHHHSEEGEERVLEIPDAPQPGYDFAPWTQCIHGWDIPGEAERPELPWAPGTREFPFISSCLRLALNRDGVYGTRLGDVQEQPLETTFRGDKLEYGMVVFDISDLDSVRYGIIGSEVSYVADISLLDFFLCFGWDAKRSQTPDREAVPQIEEAPSRLPLSGAAYMRKYRLDYLTDPIRRLEKQRIVNHRALNCKDTYFSPESSAYHLFIHSLQISGRGLAAQGRLDLPTQRLPLARTLPSTEQLHASFKIPQATTDWTSRPTEKPSTTRPSKPASSPNSTKTPRY